MDKRSEYVHTYRGKRRASWNDPKTCSKCNTTKTLREYYNGDSWCIECRKSDALNKYHQSASAKTRKEKALANRKMSQHDYYLLRKRTKEQDDGTTLESVREKIDKMHVYVTNIRNGRSQELPQEFVKSEPVRRRAQLVQDGDRWMWT